jgi:phage-related minor tail protein
MAFTLADALVMINADDSPLKGKLTEAETTTKGWAAGLGGKVATLAGGAIVAGAAAIATGIIAIGATALNVQGDLHAATNALITGTGASGEALAEMRQGVINLGGSAQGFGHDMETIGATMAEVNTRLGLTGDGLEDLTGQILEYSRLTGGDAVRQTQLMTRVMGDWDVANEDAGQTLDMVYGAGQAFGIGVDDLAAKVVQFGAPMRQMGFDLETSIALFGKWEKEGVNAELAIGSLRIAAGQFARDNIPLQEGLQDTMDAIKGASSESEALAIAMDVFGARAGPDMAAAIREGRFELDEAIEALRGTQGGLADAAERSLGFREQWQIAMNGARLALAPLGDMMGRLVEQVLPYAITLIETLVGILGRFFGNLEAGMSPLQALIAALEGIVPPAVLEKLAFLGGLLESIFQGAVENAGLMIAGLKALFEGDFETFFTNLGLIVENKLLLLAELFGTLAEKAIPWLLTVWQAFQDWFNDIDWGELGYIVMMGILTTLAFFWDEVLPTVRGWWDSFSKWFGEQDWGALGRTLVDGVIAGLSNLGQRLIDGLVGAASGAWQAWNDFWQSRSPSRLMRNSMENDIMGAAIQGVQARKQDLALEMAGAGSSAFAAWQGAGAAGNQFSSADQFNFDVRNARDAELAARLAANARRRQLANFVKR